MLPGLGAPLEALYDSGVVLVSQMNSSREVTVVAVAGLDPSGGAGLIRDVLTGAAVGAQVIAVGTAWTVQPSPAAGDASAGVHRVEPREPDALRHALEDALRQRETAEVSAGEAYRLAVKVGMVPNAAVAAAIVRALDAAGFAGPVVVDPVLAASSGGALWQEEPRGLLPLLRRATLVTPNGPEAAALSRRPVQSLAEATEAARALCDQGVAAVLIKGGHLGPAQATVTDVLVGPDGVEMFSRPRLPGPGPRGTGCALSTAIAAKLAAGLPLAEAVRAATDWLSQRFAGAVTVGGQRHLP